jgi:hypothetical protein
MSLFSAEMHADNPPETWQVVKVLPRVWQLQTKDGDVLESFSKASAAEEAKHSGFYVKLYDQESRWYAGEQIPGWQQYKNLVR